ncbi:hypothetical protein BDW22DRAFT_1343718 [Trametopsis cervina]|nr:hypothetical protein BDW22DRAFT_1343718 [Trametopsis cervina]
MSYNNQNNATTWNNDTNNLSNTTGVGRNDNFNDDNFNSNNPDSALQGGNVRSAGYGSGVGTGQGGFNRTQHEAFAGNTSDVNTYGAGGDMGMGHRERGLGNSGMPGNTSDVNTYGAGGDMGMGQRERGLGHTGVQGNTSDINTYGAGGDIGGRDNGRFGEQDWNNDSTGQSGYPGNTTDSNTYGTGSAGKASMGDRVKGTMEKMTGKMTGNPNMVERGQDRKDGDLGTGNY